ncbi:esterase-like activity of phytase family protein [Campylobacter geochelonis]|uniref:Putative periplasmic protein n=1 Tax=Campylobacter geochelonis TaxID=1780362 RepID=A0A128EC09_9BACT|nr:esterase-like activity of phytase family protein [Campylobacter geochelonis]QKF72225.1 esterase-like protein [Campylobacter geochelonis]CZE46479.1 putative periplasmic protein [Campylobacter geochelonis]
MKKAFLILAFLTSSIFATQYQIQEVNMPFGDVGVKMPIKLDVGFGSGAFYDKKSDSLYVITDRGANIDCDDTKKILGKKLCKKGKIFPFPKFTPTIYKLNLLNNKFEVTKQIPLRTKSKALVSGISNPQTEISYDLDLNELDYDVNGIDSEAISMDKDGKFYIADEYGPSIFITNSIGEIQERWVPNGVGKSLFKADYDIVENIPAKLRNRQLNRGFEAVAISPDSTTLYTMLQSPYKDEISSKKVPLLLFDIKTKKLIKQLYYPLDNASSFIKDNTKKKRKQNDVKVSEMSMLENGDLIVLERINKTTKFYKVDVKNAKDESVLKKELIFNTDSVKNFPSKIEALGVVSDTQWILINDNDFGINGEKTQIIRLNLR